MNARVILVENWVGLTPKGVGLFTIRSTYFYHTWDNRGCVPVYPSQFSEQELNVTENISTTLR